MLYKVSEEILSDIQFSHLLIVFCNKELVYCVIGYSVYCWKFVSKFT